MLPPFVELFEHHVPVEAADVGESRPDVGAQPVESPPRDRCGKVPGGQGREPRGGSRRRSRIGNREAVPRGRDGIGDTTAGIASHAGGEEGAPRPVGRGYVPSRRRAGFR